MDFTSARYGTNGKYVDVTSIVQQQFTKYGYIIVNNDLFGDPCLGHVKHLILNTKDGEVTIAEGQKYFIEPSEIPDDIILKCYYHIFCGSNPTIFEIVAEQLSTIKSSPIYDRFKEINMCITGDHMDNYNAVLDKLRTVCEESGGKFKIHKQVFGDKTYERYTLYAIKDDPDLNSDNTFILYLHSKGVSRKTDIQSFISKWRQCMQHFLLTRANKCINQFLLNKYNTVGIFYILDQGHEYYGGNFWWAKGSYLKKLFDTYEIGPDYFDTEKFILKLKPTNLCDMYKFSWSWKQLEPNLYKHL
ncbi:MAG: hypothetical protein ACYCQJ_12580 [Nitrososphaerales archaeon]